MSKYNRIVSIPIDSIPKEEISIAIKEWAEGDEAMERLLWTFYDKNIKTNGCHAGARPYIGFRYQKRINEVIPLFDTILTIPGSQILASIDGGNPFSGPEWHLASITLGFDTKSKQEADEYLDKLNDTLKNSNKEDLKHPIIDLLEFFLDKETGLLIRYVYTEDKKYIFTLETSKTNDKRYNYYHNIFTKAGFEEEIKVFDETYKRYYWDIKSENFNEISKKIKDAVNLIINEYSLEPDTNEKDIDRFNLIARLKRKNLSPEEFDKWLTEERIKRDKAIEEMRKKKEEAEE